MLNTRHSRAARRSAVALAALVLPLTACGGETWSPEPGADPETGGKVDPSSLTIGGLPAPMPDLDLPGFAGAAGMNLRDITEPTLVNVWATWCTPCRAEMPVLEEFNAQHGDTVKVLGINYQDPREQAAVEFAEETGVTYPSLRDVDGEINRLKPFPFLRGLPFMAMVVDGEMVGAKYTEVETLAEVEALVETLMPGVLGKDEVGE